MHFARAGGDTGGSERDKTERDFSLPARVASAEGFSTGCQPLSIMTMYVCTYICLRRTEEDEERANPAL